MRLLTTQNERNVDELIQDNKQLKNKMSTYQMEIRSKNDT